MTESLKNIFRNDQSPLKGGLVTSRIIMEQEQSYTSPEEAMAGFLTPSGEGWLLTVETREPYLLPGDSPADGEYPLSGEKALDDGQSSLRLYQNGSGGWTITKLTEVEETADNSGPTAFVREVKHFARDKNKGKLVYQVCQQPGENSTATVPGLSRFIGFQK